MTNILFAQMLCSRRLTAYFESQPVFLRRETENKKKKNGEDFMEMRGHAPDAPRQGNLLLAVRIISFDHIVFIEDD